MSTTIDQRVVEMRFDNKQFEENVKTSISTLDKLKQSLNLTGASKGLENIGTAAKNINMSGLSGAVENVRLKFSALEVMAVTALANITNSAINAGKRIVSALTIKPISEGFGEYELKMGSIQTIMASTGESLETVNKYLQELNVYADKTIYSFADMTNNIGKFTNAGVSLKDAVAAIQGVSNVAAVSGANANEASRAMYNFAQALSAGYVKLIDWKSIENANMATVEFKNQLLETALAVGTVTKTADGMYKTLKGNVFNATKNFNEVLQDQWMTTEVLVKTLGKYADETTDIGKKAFAAAQDIKTFSQLFDTLKEAAGSGWAQTWEILIGDFEEAKEILTELGGVIGGFIDRTSDARNELLRLWKENGGREALIEAFRNSFEALGKIIKPISEAFRDIFPPTTSEQLLNLTNGLKTFTERLKIGDDTADKIKRTFKGLFAVLDMVKDAFSFVFKVAGQVFSLFGGPTAGGILELTARFGDFLVKLHETAEAGNIFGRAFEKIQEIFTIVADKIKDAIDRIGSAFKGFKSIDMGPLDEFSEKAEKRLRPFTRLGQIFGAAFEAIVKVLEWVAPIVAKLGSIIGKGLGALADKVSYAVENMEFNEILDLINTGLFGTILFGIKKFINSLTDITSGAGGFLEGITNILDGVRGSLEAYQSSLKAKTLITIASAIGILAAALVVISLIDSEKLSTSLTAITVLFVELALAMKSIQKTLGRGKMAKVSIQMIAMATAILILSSAMKNLASLDWEGVAKGTAGIAALAAVLVIAAKSLNKSSGKLIKGSTGLIAFAAAILIMSKAVESMSELSWEELAKGLTGLTVILAEVVAVTRLMGDPKHMISTGIGMIALGAAMLIFAEAVEHMGQLSWEEIGKGLVTMAGALTAITIAMNLLPKGMINKATGMVVMGAALLIIGEAVGKMGSLNWGEIARGLTTLAGALAAITLALNFMPQGMIAKATGLIGVAAALTILVKPLREMGSMSWEEIAKGLVTLAGSMTILAVALNAMQKAIPGAAAMMIVAPALAIMAGVLGTLGRMPLSEIGIGLLALAGAFAVLGASALILRPLVPTIIGLGAAIALLGVGIAAVGVGVLAFSTALTALSVSATAVAGAIVVIGSAILSLIPIFFEKIGEGLIALGNTIINGAPIIKDAFLILLASALEALTEAIPMITESVFTLLNSVLDALVKYTPGIVEKIFDFLIVLIDAITKKLPELIQAGVDVLMAFFSGIIDALSGIDVEVLLKGIAGIGLLSAIMLALAAVASLVPGAMIGVLGMGVVIAELALVLAAIGALAQIPGLKWFINEGAELMQGIGNAIGSFIGGIVGGFMGGVSSSFPKIGADLSAFMTNVQPFLDGASKIDASTMDGVKALAETILILTAANILEGLTSWFTGGSSMTKFGRELAEFGPYFKSYYESIKGVDGSVVEASANAALALAEFAKEIPNSGGVVGWFAGENSLSAFAEELMEFGPKLKSYADSVKGLDASVVINSANAAKALAEMATNLPNSGGVVGWFTGENSLSVFAEELMDFGPKLKAYADSVRGLNGDVVVNSANAAKALAEMSNNLPNQGGAVSWFTGDNTLTVFGEELAAFGPSLKAYADSVRGLDGNVVVNSANAAKALAELSTNLPNTGGIVSWFTGDNDIASFGKQLVSFGQSFASYYKSISTVNTAQLSGVVTEFKKLVDLAKGIQNVDTSGMSTFGKNLKALGNAGIDGFINAFTNANSRVSAAATTMLTTFINSANAKKAELITTFNNIVQAVITAINGKQALFTTAGNTLMVQFIAGIRSKDAASRTALVTIISSCLTVIKNKYYEFQTMGQTLMVQFIAGIKSKDVAVSTTFIQIISGCLTQIKNKYSEFNTAGNTLTVKFIDGIKSKNASVSNTFIQIISGGLTKIRNKYTDFYDAGKYLVEGLANGIKNRKSKVTNAAREVAKDALTAAKNVLGIKSPSKEFEQIGKYANEGFAGGLTRFADVVVDSAKDVGQSTIDALSRSISNIADVIDSDVEFNPVLRPVVDLSDVNDDISSAFANPRILKVVASYDKAVTATARNNNVVNPRPNSGISGEPDNIVINNNFTVHAVIREEADIQKVSRGLFELQRRASRTAGLISS